MTADFGLDIRDFFGGLTDTGSYAKSMVTKGIGLRSKWCIARLFHTATKFPFGIEARTTTKNPDMTLIVEDLRRAVRDVRTMDSLF